MPGGPGAGGSRLCRRLTLTQIRVGVQVCLGCFGSTRDGQVGQRKGLGEGHLSRSGVAESCVSVAALVKLPDRGAHTLGGP